MYSGYGMYALENFAYTWSKKAFLNNVSKKKKYLIIDEYHEVRQDID